MCFSSRQCVVAACVASMLLLPARLLAQGKPQEISFETADKVELKGTFYAGGGKSSPAILMIHDIGSDRSKGGWDELGKLLSKEGFAALSFDFRAHGESTVVVDPKVFWANGLNARTFRPTKERDKIGLADFMKNRKIYQSMLINDIAAAKRYLDVRNDSEDCNTANTIIIAAGEGAALATIWMSREMTRIRLIPNPLNPMFPPQIDPKRRMEGEDIRSAIWLSIPDRFGADSMSTILKTPAIRDKIPMAFFYGEQDDVHAKAAQAIYSTMKIGAKDFDATRLRKKDTKSAGAELLGKKLETEEDIVNYIRTVMDRKAEKAWNKRDAEKLPPPPIK